MAKAKKETSPFVPVEEQPYPVPENWCWTYVGNLCTFIGGGTPNKSNVEYWNGDIHWASVKDVKGDYLYGTIDKITKEGLKNSAANSCQVNDLLLITRIEPAKTIISKIETAINQDLKIVKSNLSSVFLHYYFKAFRHEFERKSSGSTVLGITIPNVNNTIFPLPPVAEQQRIVDRIESLFAKLDEAKEKAQAVVDGYEQRKAAILHRAFTGELTKEWRKELRLSFDEWEKRSLKNCGSWHGGGTPSMAHPEYWDNGDLLWITSKDMKSDLIEDSLMHINRTGIENSSAIFSDEPSLLFVTRSGILRRTLPISMVKVPFTINQDLKSLTPNDIDLEYLFWACKASEQIILNTCMKSGTTVESINTSALLNYEIPICSREEQLQIVSVLGRLLCAEQQAKETAEAVIDQIETMKKSILARAFRGELGTNDPAEESAAELLNAGAADDRAND